ncbi:MAG: hypothetical protein PHH70_02630 [Candidatus Gracilibacteria bacterium]|nr:hypothetical protein [Candidatus Gracilibacteria bacterium]
MGRLDSYDFVAARENATDVVVKRTVPGKRIAAPVSAGGKTQQPWILETPAEAQWREHVAAFNKSVCAMTANILSANEERQPGTRWWH